MLNRKFTFRENLLLGFFTALMMLAFYYLLVIEPLYQEVGRDKQKQIILEDELKIQQYMSERKKDMLKQIENEPEGGNGELGIYSNLKNEIKELEEILAGVQAYNLSFSQAEASDNIVRRDIVISYQTQTYDQACDILEAVENGRYQCLIKDVSLWVGSNKEQESSDFDMVYGNLLVTYYETLIRAEESGFMEGGDGESDGSKGETGGSN